MRCTHRDISTHGEVVSERFAWWNRALADPGRPVHVRGPVHEKAVEMERGRLVAQLVVDIDDDAVSYVGLNAWNRPLAVDADDGPLMRAIWIRRDPSDVEVVCDGGGRDEAQRGGQQKRCWLGEHGDGEYASYWRCPSEVGLGFGFGNTRLREGNVSERRLGETSRDHLALRSEALSGPAIKATCCLEARCGQGTALVDSFFRPSSARVSFGLELA